MRLMNSRYEYGYDYDQIEIGKEIGIGWVDVNSSVFSEKSGRIANFQVLTREIKKCQLFRKKDKWD